MPVTYAEKIDPNPPATLTDETLEPKLALVTRDVGSRLVPISFEAVGASSVEPRYYQFHHAASELLLRMQADFLAVSEIPELGEDAHSYCLDTAAAYGEKEKIVPVIRLEGEDVEEVIDNVIEYSKWGARKALVRAQLPEDLTFGGSFSAAPTDLLIPIIRKVGELDSVGVIIPTGAADEFSEVEEEYDRLAEIVDAADFAVTEFLLDAVPYARLVGEMRKREVSSPILPGIKPFRNYGLLTGQADRSNTTIPDSLQYTGRLGNPEQPDELTRHFITLGVDLVKVHDAPGLHVYTDNNMKATQLFVEGVEFQINH